MISFYYFNNIHYAIPENPIDSLTRYLTHIMFMRQTSNSSTSTCKFWNRGKNHRSSKNSGRCSCRYELYGRPTYGCCCAQGIWIRNESDGHSRISRIWKYSLCELYTSPVYCRWKNQGYFTSCRCKDRWYISRRETVWTIPDSHRVT